MSYLLENGKMSEKKINENFSYILETDCSLNQMEYKVMHNKDNSEFVRCMNMLYNGKTQLLYMPGELKTLKSMARGISEEDFITLVANLLGCVTLIKKNGFLSCQNIEVSEEKIYVDEGTFGIKLVYVPIQPKLFENYAAFENALRIGLTRLINAEFNMQSKRIQQLYYELYDTAVRLEDLCDKLRTKGNVHNPSGRAVPPISSAAGPVLVALNSPRPFKIEINRDVVSIGRNTGMADIVIDFNGTIGRKHCTVMKNGRQLMIKDENSVNGTFVNEVRIMPGQVRMLNNGDIVRLSDTRFRVSM